jgi:hypothetical protein
MGSSDERKLSRRERRQLEKIGTAIDQAVGSYDEAKAQDPRIEEALRGIDEAPNTLVFALDLNVAAALGELHRHGSYRLDWVMAGIRNLGRLTAAHNRVSDEQAEAQVNSVVGQFSDKFGQNLIVWMTAPSTEKEDVVSIFVHMIDALGLPDPREAETESDQAPPAEDALTRLALLYQNGLITEDEYRLLLKDKLIES